MYMICLERMNSLTCGCNMVVISVVYVLYLCSDFVRVCMFFLFLLFLVVAFSAVTELAK